MSIIFAPVSISNMNVDEWLTDASAQLKKSTPESPRLDCLVLLSKVLNLSQAQILARLETQLNANQVNILNELLENRKKGVPIAYLTSTKEFYGRTFMVNKDVLIPRPESEDIIDLLKKHVYDRKSVVDIGTGSGCLAITAKLELQDLQVIGSDVSKKALKVARFNAEKLDAKVKFINTNLTVNFKSSFDIYLANLPYVPYGHKVSSGVKFEPEVAVYGGYDGLDFYRQLFNQLAVKAYNSELVICESLVDQHQKLAGIAKKNGFKQIDELNLVQVFQAN